jgi:hypothetical protein
MARWVFPGAGLELYADWAHADLPQSADELFLAGQLEAAYTFGFQWAQRRGPSHTLRLQTEFTDLEQSRVYPGRLTPDFYSGRGSPQGYTERGQLIGAGIGPGASAQWTAVDRFAPRWQIGGFVGRVRWDNDAMYRQVGATFWKHDFTLLSGLRAGWRASAADISAELTVARRYNYLFQNGYANAGGYRTVDVNNVTLAMVATRR